MKTQLSIATIIFLLITGCSPRIGTVIQKTRPVGESHETIGVWMDVLTVPANSEVLGTVSVTDGGFTTKCDSLTVVNLLKEEARKAGGNAVLVTKYVKPSFWGSSCHQMTATILKINDYAAQDGMENPDSSRFALSPSIHLKRKLPKMNLSANLGQGWRLAQLNPNLPLAERVYQKNMMSGLTWDASFKYYLNDRYGIGLLYASYAAGQRAYGTATFNGVTEEGYRNTNNHIQFLGSAFSARVSSSNLQWLFDFTVGIGYLSYSSIDRFAIHIYKVNGSTAGDYTNLGIEYKFNKNWGIGVRCSLISGIVTKLAIEDDGHKETLTVNNRNEGEGLGQIQLSAGIRYYFGK
jgi:hypothetical protein